MKYLILFLFLQPFLLFAQKNENKSNIEVDIGLLIHRNYFNEDNYLNNKSPFGQNSNRSLAGLDIRFIIPTKIDYINIIFGALIENCWDEYSTTATDYKGNGGGVYMGLNPRTNGKNFGLTSVFTIGVLSYKEYFSFYSETPPVADIYEKKTSFGWGAMSSVGFYLRGNRLGINPQVQAVFSGGHEASFLFYGVVLPLTVRF